MSSSSSSVNVDLARERQGASIDSEDFARWWAGGSDKLEERRSLERYVFEDAELEEAVHPSCLSYKERYEQTIVRSTKFLAKLRQWHSSKHPQFSVSVDSLREFRVLLSGQLGTALFQQSFPLRLHLSMFLTTLLGQGTDEQLHKWLSRAWHMDGIIGTYAQTELGHGTYIRGLETRADYDAESEEFVLNTPSLSAYKWWPGGLGNTANMTIVLAQLYVKGRHHGLQPFLVRIRDEETHQPLPGIDVGDIGPKLGGNGVNNGFLGLRNVRIPRDQMLMKNAQVLPDGTFVQGRPPLLLYGTMVYVRVITLRDVLHGLLQAATIATRYSVVRRQSPIDESQPEVQILDHITQQVKVLPQIARGVCYRLAADWLWNFYARVLEQLEVGAGQHSLPELHALSCCLKAVGTDEASEGIDLLRKSCGGHGFLSSANFDSIYGMATAAYTYEGEYTVLLLQTARFLVRQYTDSLKRKVLPVSVTYLRNTARLNWGKNLAENAARALEISALEQTRLAWQSQSMHRQRKLSEQQANNLSGRQLTAAAIAHAHAFLTRNALQELERLRRGSLSPQVSAVLGQLVELFVLDTFLRQAGSVLRWNSITGSQLRLMERRFEQLLAELRPNAVALVDGFDFHDRTLGSTLGSYDGRVYERLMAEARRNPLNQEPVNATFRSHLQPMMRGKL
ncbi:probable peroxisomal acyl-coenzyme A oxidase 1 [Drosophila guanche]|uniref:Acyl-coenzyme A oxidase n=1 Tax=Drosophila guanche TaxID=7266 RepID=A0A3B0JVN3_DROGU|nr:probable peroxisomal acyl-coenzyme A oxidase 1 [Drosophila guanche]SPP77779.1 blast:Probable peroxisomal acyl-coenzyme A oxidase 1 [Drosophila guanche]